MLRSNDECLPLAGVSRSDEGGWYLLMHERTLARVGGVGATIWTNLSTLQILKIQKIYSQNPIYSGQ